MDKRPSVHQQSPAGQQQFVARQDTLVSPARPARFFVVPWLAMFAVSFHIYAMAVLLPGIVRTFGTTVGTVQAAIVLSTLVSAAFIPTSENLAKNYGAKRLFNLGLLAFVAGILVTACSPSILVLIFGTSILTSLAMAPLVSTPWEWAEYSFEGTRRSLAELALSISALLGSLLGPLLCGWISTQVGWRWALAPQLVLALLVFWQARSLPESSTKQDVPIDWIGGLLSIIGLGAVLVGSSIAGQYGWWAPRDRFVLFGVAIPPFPLSIVPIFLGIGVVFIGIAIFWQRRQASRGRVPIWRVGTFSNRSYVAALLTGTLYSATAAGMTYSLYLFLPSMLGLPPLQTALAVLPFSLSLAVSMLATFYLGRWIVQKRIVQVGLVILAIGVYLLYRAIDPAMATDSVLWALIVTGAGGGVIVGQMASLAFSTAAPRAHEAAEESGLLPVEAVGIYNTFQDLAYALGTAVFGTILISVASTNIVDGVLERAEIVVDAQERAAIIYDFQEMVQTLTAQELDAEIASWPLEVQRAFDAVTSTAIADAMQITLLVILATVVAVLAVSFLLPRSKMTR